MRRFFVKEEIFDADEALIAGELWHYLSHVLRLKAGDEVELITDKGTLYKVRLEEFAQESIKGRVIAKSCEESDTKVEIALYQGLPKGDKLDLIVQKCTELGVSSITPVEMPRSIAKIGADKAEKKTARWQKIAQEAAQQSKRRTVPVVHEPLGWKNFLAVIKESEGLNLLLWEDEATLGLKDILEQNSNARQINLVIGPEGGLGESEVKELKDAGFVSVSLGRRILRTETAGMAAVAMILYHFDDLG